MILYKIGLALFITPKAELHVQKAVFTLCNGIYYRKSQSFQPYGKGTRTTVCESVLSGRSRICVREVLAVPSDSRLEMFEAEEILSDSMFS